MTGRILLVMSPHQPFRITIRLTPRAALDEIVGFDGDTLRVRVTAPPTNGRANEALERLLAERLHVRRSAVRIVYGHGARQKLVEISGLTAESVLRQLGAKR
jgi:uncharacterized protein (TIGR00251 family)